HIFSGQYQDALRTRQSPLQLSGPKDAGGIVVRNNHRPAHLALFHKRDRLIRTAAATRTADSPITEIKCRGTVGGSFCQHEHLIPSIFGYKQSLMRSGYRKLLS